MAERNQSVAWGCQSKPLRQAENTNAVSAPQCTVLDLSPAHTLRNIEHGTEEDKQQSRKIKRERG